MKKMNFLFILFILSACTPQVTITSEVTVTLTPYSTETLVSTDTPMPEPTAHNTITTDTGLEIVVDENGVITEFVPPDNIAHSEGAVDKYNQPFETVQDIFDEGQWVYQDRRVVLLDLATQTVFAEHKLVSESSGKFGVVVDWNQLDFEKLAEDALVWKMKNSQIAVNQDEAVVSYMKLSSNYSKKIPQQSGFGEELVSITGPSICSNNGKECIFTSFVEFKRSSTETRRGMVFFWDKEQAKAFDFIVENVPKE